MLINPKMTSIIKSGWKFTYRVLISSLYTIDTITDTRITACNVWIDHRVLTCFSLLTNVLHLVMLITIAKFYIVIAITNIILMKILSLVDRMNLETSIPYSSILSIAKTNSNTRVSWNSMIDIARKMNVDITFQLYSFSEFEEWVRSLFDLTNDSELANRAVYDMKL